MGNRVNLGVNVDHIATLRQARGVDFPDPVDAALIAEKAGANSITMHLREDRRHIQDVDIYNFSKVMNTHLNLEMAITKETIITFGNIELGKDYSQDQLNDMGVKIENIGEPDAVSVNGYNKLMDAYDDYGLQNVIKAIDKIEELQQDSKAAAWNDNGKPLVGGLIAGLAALYHLLPFLGRGDKSYALRCYLDNNLKMLKPVGKKSLMSDIGGDLQSTLFARRIVNSCNALIQQGYIRKRNGDLLLVQIEETVLSRAGLGDPTGTQIQSKEKED